MSSNFRILHCLRAPVGGLFRHVHDLALGQAELGAEVGIVCDSTTGDAESDVALRRLRDNCSLGVTRIPMARKLHLSDWSVYRRIAKIGRKLGVDVLHGHGAKGGAYARLAGKSLRKRKNTKVVYTPPWRRHPLFALVPFREALFQTRAQAHAADRRLHLREHVCR